MASPATLVAKMLKLRGQPATLIWETPGLDVDVSSASLNVNVFIDSRGKSQHLGTLNSTVKAYLPITDRELTSARLLVGSANYQVLSFQVIASAYQEVILSWAS